MPRAPCSRADWDATPSAAAADALAAALPLNEPTRSLLDPAVDHIGE